MEQDNKVDFGWPKYVYNFDLEGESKTDLYYLQNFTVEHRQV